MSKFVDVILPVPIGACFTYILRQEDENVKIGCRVIIPFGKKKIYTGIVWRIKDTAPEGIADIKEVYSVLDKQPIINSKQRKFWEWMSSYYLCSLGDIFKAAIPSGMKIESETYVMLTPDFDEDIKLTNKENIIYNSLKANKEQTIAQIEKSTQERNILSSIKSLIEKGVVSIRESLNNKYHSLKKANITLNQAYNTPAIINELISQVQRGRSENQYRALTTYLNLIHYDESSNEISAVDKKELTSQSSTSDAIINSMVKKGIFNIVYEKLNRIKEFASTQDAPNALNEYQQEALNSINKDFDQKDVCLLNGVTSSGKTEIYIHLIHKTIECKKQVLYLLPEIALTTQITNRLRKIFGKDLGVYHSKFSDAERVEIWQKQLSDNAYKVILGVRSSIFLPFQDLGLIIVDEEHENSYKQYDPSPRYNARDCATVLAHIYNAKTLLGTATPSIESYYNAANQKYGYVELNTRYKEIQLPHIVPVDMKELRHKKRNVGSFSPLLIEEINNALQRKEQIILFQNRRGYAPIIECKECGWIPKCKNCDVSLTYHKKLNQLTCHYCGYTITIPQECPSCHNHDLRPHGLGTEKVEDEISNLFPNIKVSRMDLDTTRTSKSAYEKIISNFENKKSDILIGTQMVSKGLDFDNVSIVGILDADSLLNFPDFRAHERAFQLMAQVSGRAGRKGKQGLVILQTRTPDDPIIKHVIKNDYLAMYESQLMERQLFHYPPFFRIIYIYMKHHNENVLENASNIMAELTRYSFHNRVLGPDKPLIGRIQSLHIRRIVLKLESHSSIKQAGNILNQIKSQVLSDKRFSSVTIYFDVDPQ